MIGTGERPVLASCFIYTSYPARPQPHLSILVVWDLKSKKKKKLTLTHTRASHAHTGHGYCYTWFFLNLDYAQQDHRATSELCALYTYYAYTRSHELWKKKPIKNTVLVSHFTISAYIVFVVYGVSRTGRLQFVLDDNRSISTHIFFFLCGVPT